MREIKLLPCPFCGGEAFVRKNKDLLGTYSAYCGDEDCSISPMVSAYSREMVVGLWNTRKPMERIVERLEELHKYNSEQADIYRDSEIQNVLTRERKDMYMDRANCYGVAIRTIKAGGKNE